MEQHKTNESVNPGLPIEKNSGPVKLPKQVPIRVQALTTPQKKQMPMNWYISNPQK